MRLRRCVQRRLSRRGARIAVLGVLAVIASAFALVAICVGPVNLPVRDVFVALGSLFKETGDPSAALVNAVRLPRVLIALLVGAALGVSGAAMQAVLRNSLAEPGITGVSAGAALVAVFTITTGLAARFPFMLPLGAFAGSVAAVAIVQAIALGAAGRSPAALILVGLSLNAFLGALISALIANAKDAADAQSAVFWLNGDLNGTNMQEVGLVVVPLLIGTLGLLVFARPLNVMMLGDHTAMSSGVNVTLVRQLVLIFAALATASGVAVTGTVAFVGLVVPHVIRLLFGADHRLLLPASTLGGAAFLVLADTCARMLFSPIALQTGTITSLIGAPFLLFLVLRRMGRLA